MPNPKSIQEQKQVMREARRNANITRALQEKEYLNAVREAIDPSDMKEIVEQIVRDAKDTEHYRVCNAARTWLGQYVLRGGRISFKDIDSPPVVEKS